MSETKAKSGTPAPGVGAAAQTGAKDPAGDQAQASTSVPGQILVADEPEWVQKIIEALQGFNESILLISASNEEVVKSNQASMEACQGVIEIAELVLPACEGTMKAVKTFDERAKDVVQEIMKEAKGVAGANAPVVETPKVELNPEAKYRVAKGQSFQDKNDPELVYKEGKDVSSLEPERLENLLAQGIIEEA